MAEEKSFLVDIVVLVLVAAVIGGWIIYNYTKGENQPAIPNPNRISIEANINYRPFVVIGGNLTKSFDSENFCEKLKNAVKRSLLSGNASDVDIITYGTDFNVNYPFPTRTPIDCTGKVSLDLASGIKQTMCTLNPHQLNYIKVTDEQGLSFRDCELSNYDEQAISQNMGYTDVYFNPNRLYTKEFYPSSGSYLGSYDYSNWYNGPAKMRIKIGNASIDSYTGDCYYTLRFCNQPEFMENEADSIKNVFKAMQILELEHLPVVTYDVNDLSSSASKLSGHKVDLYYYNEFTIDLDKGYNVTEIINAIKIGIYDNFYRLKSNDTWTHPNWLVLPDYSMSYDYPWNTIYDYQLKSSNSNFETREIRYDCGDDGICNGKLKIKVAIRRDYTSNDGTEALLSGIITFVEENPEFRVTKFNYVGGDRIIQLDKKETIDFGSKLSFVVCHYERSSSSLLNYEIFDKNTVSVLENPDGKNTHIFVACD